MNPYKPIDPNECPPDGWYWFREPNGSIEPMKVEDGFYMRVVRYVSRWEWIELDQYRYTHYCPATPPEFPESEL